VYDLFQKNLYYHSVFPKYRADDKNFLYYYIRDKGYKDDTFYYS
jgi:hypothetical protein